MRTRKRVFWGVIFLLGALAAVLGGLGYLKGIGTWTILFGIALSGIFVDGIAKRRWGRAAFAVTFLVILVSKALGAIPLSFWQIFGAACLAAIGLSILFPSRHKPKVVCGSANDIDVSNFVDGGECMRCEVTFGNANRYINSSDLRQLDLEAAFGTMRIYLDNVVLKNNCATVHVDVSFSSVQLYLPREWNVVTNVDHSFGSVRQFDQFSLEGGCTLQIVGEVAFGTLELHCL